MIAIVSTVRTAPTDLKLFVSYHLNCGVDRIFLFFDNPDDTSISLLEDDARIVCTRCDGAHWAASGLGIAPATDKRQIYNADLSLKWARKAGADWLIHVDSDELILTPNYDIKSYLRNITDADAVIFPTLEALPRMHCREHPFQELTWFKIDGGRPRAQRLAGLMGCSGIMRHGYIKGHTAGKTALRTSSDVESVQVHRPFGRDLKFENSDSSFVLHFDCCTFDDWVSKWKKRYDGITDFQNMSDARKQQFAEFCRAYETGSEDRLRGTFRQSHIASKPQQAVLLCLGFLRRVNVPATLFADPTAGSR
jgi:hypothetical protein